jgi:tetratricopeptide (TPR) repeat protein
MSNPTPGNLEEGRRLLQMAKERHAANSEEALALARRAIKVAPDLADAWSYLGTTLITRRLDFSNGLAALDRSAELAPDDPGVNYTLGWCYEFVAYRLSRQGSGAGDPEELFDRAARYLRHCIELNPEQGLKEDAEDLLAAIENRR